MTKIICSALLWACLLLPFRSSSQEMFGGSAEYEPTPCITDVQRAEIISMLQQNVADLEKSGQLSQRHSNVPTLFDWVLKQASGFTENGYYMLANYVDEDPTYPNHLLDYNCGNRTYDLASGYNHQGTDIALFPFGWNKMDNNAVEIIAGAAGTIIGKTDGNFDHNCSFNSATWNAVYIQHADGSVAWYGHMKSGSLTSKIIGNSVAKGEYLGRVGSSGSSTAPHLHFEVYTNNSYTTLVDPWAGTCNAHNGTTSWWASQQNYHVPTLNKIATHKTAPYPYGCPDVEKTNYSNAFMPNDTLFFGTYYRDQENGTTATFVIYKPNNSIWKSWSAPFTNYYSSSYWYWYFKLPVDAPTGTWKCTGNYNGQTLTHFFTVGIVSGVSNQKNVPRIACYPNPATSSITIEIDGKTETAEIYNELMQLVGTKELANISQKNTLIPVDQLSKGIYFLVLKNGNGDIQGQTTFVKE